MAKRGTRRGMSMQCFLQSTSPFLASRTCSGKFRFLLSLPRHDTKKIDDDDEIGLLLSGVHEDTCKTINAKATRGTSDRVWWARGGEFLGPGRYSEHPSIPPSLSVAVTPPFPYPFPCACRVNKTFVSNSFDVKTMCVSRLASMLLYLSEPRVHFPPITLGEPKLFQSHFKGVDPPSFGVPFIP